MEIHTATPVYFSPLENIVEISNPATYHVDTLIGRNCKRVGKEVAIPKFVAPTSNKDIHVIDYLLDEPLLTRHTQKYVHHKIFGLGNPIHRKQLDNGSFVVVVKYGDLERTLAIDAAYWFTPIEKLLQVKMQKPETFKFHDGSPSTMDSFVQQRFAKCLRCKGRFTSRTNEEKEATSVDPYCGDCRSARSQESVNNVLKVVRFHQVTPEDVNWATRQSPFPHSQSMPRPIKNFCPELGMYIQDNWQPRDGSTSSNHTNLVAGYQKKSLKAWEEDLKFQREHLKTIDLNQWETKLLDGHDGVGNSFEAWMEAGYPEVVELVKTSDACSLPLGQVQEIGSRWHEASIFKRNRMNSSRRAFEIFNAQQSWKRVPPTKTKCLHCGHPFVARKGTKYCLRGSCRQRHHEELNIAKSTRSEQTYVSRNLHCTSIEKRSTHGSNTTK